MSVAVIPDHKGQQVAAAGDRIKAMLAPLAGACRYREQRGDDAANFDVRPRSNEALAFTIGIAPGGIDLQCSAFSIRELPLDKSGIAIEIVAAILSGRIRQVRQIKSNGSARAMKTYVFNAGGQLVFKSRKGGILSYLAGRSARSERVRYADYRGS
jgi:hypothetical protein